MHIQMERLYEAARALRGINTQAELARALNQSSQTVNNWEARGISMPGMLKAQAAIGCSATWLATGDGPMTISGFTPAPADSDGFITEAGPAAPSGAVGVRVGAEPNTVTVRAVKLKLQAGVSGFVAEPDLNIDHGNFQVPREVIDELKLNPADLLVIGVKGRSMEPMMFEDDKVLVDTSKRTPISHECFAVNWNGEAIVKMLLKKSDGWYLYSMNPDPKFHSISVRSGQCSIIGMVVWQPARILKGRL